LNLDADPDFILQARKGDCSLHVQWRNPEKKSGAMVFKKRERPRFWILDFHEKIIFFSEYFSSLSRPTNTSRRRRGTIFIPYNNIK
jgi:hypothetical protein